MDILHRRTLEQRNQGIFLCKDKKEVVVNENVLDSVGPEHNINGMD